MPVTVISLSVIAAFTVMVVVIAALVVLEPLYRPPIDDTDWMMAFVVGIATVLAGAAGIAVGITADTYDSLSWTQIVVGGMFAVFGVVMTVIGVWIYEPAADDQDQPV